MGTTAPTNTSLDRVPIPESYSNPRSPPLSVRYPPNNNSNRTNNHNTSFRQQNPRYNNTIYPSNDKTRQNNNNHDPQVNVAFSPDSYTPHSSHGNSPTSREAHPDVDVLTDKTGVVTVVTHQQVEDVVTVSRNGPEMVNI